MFSGFEKMSDEVMQSERRKIDFVITGLNYGGAETQVVSLLLGMDHSRYQLRLITLLPPVAFVERLESAGIPVLTLNMQKKWQAPWALMRLVRLLRAQGTELLHAHMVHANFMARLARLFVPGLRVLSSAHNIIEGGRLRELVYRWTDPLSDLNTNVSQSAVDRYVRIGASPAQKMRLVYNGIDVQRFRSSDVPEGIGEPEVFRWLAVGRLEPQKDYPTLLQAIACLARQAHRPFRLDIVGRGILDAELRALVAKLEIGSLVNFLGVRDDVDAIYRVADAFVLSSVYEGYGLVVAEAMASGLPVVVTDSGGPPEIVGSVGQVVPPGDAEALAGAMAHVMRLPLAERRQLGRNGRSRICERYSLETAVGKWQGFYEQLLAGRSGS